uniref:Uncharacterized protein n=1 Tax=Magallana gigas TaxID=29159 RepID=A0A8W8L0Q1_MAGGI
MPELRWHKKETVAGEADETRVIKWDISRNQWDCEFREYFEHHFLKFVPRNDNQKNGIFGSSRDVQTNQPNTNTTPSEKNTHDDGENSDNEEDNGGFVMELVKKEKHLKEIKSESVSKERKPLSKIVAGKEISDGVIEKMVEHERNQKGSHEPKKKLFLLMRLNNQNHQL